MWKEVNILSTISAQNIRQVQLLAYVKLKQDVSDVEDFWKNNYE